MRSGLIHLRSGKWDWRAERASLGTKVVFRLWGSNEEEMVTWLPGDEVTEAIAEEAGRDPLHRTWVDSVGLVWQISLEQVKPWRVGADSLASEEESGSVALVFARGWSKRAALVPGETRLGDLTRGELARMFEEAVTWK
jgi:hypothetical protein